MYDIIVGPLFILLLFESAHVTQRVKMIKSFFRNSEAVSTTIHTHKPLKAFNIFSDQRAVILIDLFCSIGLPLLLHLYLRIQQLNYLHPPPLCRTLLLLCLNLLLFYTTISSLSISSALTPTRSCSFLPVSISPPISHSPAAPGARLPSLPRSFSTCASGTWSIEFAAHVRLALPGLYSISNESLF